MADKNAKEFRKKIYRLNKDVLDKWQIQNGTFFPMDPDYINVWHSLLQEISIKTRADVWRALARIRSGIEIEQNKNEYKELLKNLEDIKIMDTIFSQKINVDNDTSDEAVEAILRRFEMNLTSYHGRIVEEINEFLVEQRNERIAHVSLFSCNLSIK
jgi:hypothetical protein